MQSGSWSVVSESVSPKVRFPLVADLQRPRWPAHMGRAVRLWVCSGEEAIWSAAGAGTRTGSRTRLSRKHNILRFVDVSDGCTLNFRRHERFDFLRKIVEKVSEM